MNRKSFIGLLPLTALLSSFTIKSKMKADIKIQLLRHATLLLEIQGKKILVDPMLSPKDGMDPVQNCGNDIRIPMVDLPLTDSKLEQLLKDTDAVVITHTHRDHWDITAQSKIEKSKPIFCQPADKDLLAKQGFENVVAIEYDFDWNGIKITRTGGQHGTGEIGKKMGTVSGFVFKTGNSAIYLAGDTIYCDEVVQALENHKPDVTILNAGGAKFLTGDPITMTPSDVLKVRATAPRTKIIAVHMDTVNHCLAKREHLKQALKENKAKDIFIPNDGETITA